MSINDAHLATSVSIKLPASAHLRFNQVQVLFPFHVTNNLRTAEAQERVPREKEIVPFRAYYRIHRASCTSASLGLARPRTANAASTLSPWNEELFGHTRDARRIRPVFRRGNAGHVTATNFLATRGANETTYKGSGGAITRIIITKEITCDVRRRVRRVILRGLWSIDRRHATRAQHHLTALSSHILVYY